MRYDVRCSVTLRLIFLSLFPSLSRVRSPEISVTGDQSRTMSPELLYSSLRNSGRTHVSLGRCRILVPGGCYPAAPFVLYRLKRWGFSGCRVSADYQGLHVEVRR